MNTKRLLYVMIAVLLTVAACAPQDAPKSAAAAAPAATPTSAPVASPAPASSESPRPLAYWHLNGDGKDSVGDSALEFSGLYALSDTAVSFDGHTGSASTAAPGPLDTTESFSVSAWVNYAHQAANSKAVSQLGKVRGLFGLGAVESKWVVLMISEDRPDGKGVSAQGDLAVPGSNWTHLVGVFDREAGMLRLYVNGDKQGEAAFTTPLKAEGPLTIGRGQFDSHPGNFWPGAIGEVTVYQTALTAGQVADIYQTTKPTSPPPARPAPEPSTYGNGILNGTWDYPADKPRIRLGFDNHEWWQGFVTDGKVWLVDGVPEGSGGTFTIDGNKLTTSGDGWLTTYEWTLDGDRLTTTVVKECNVWGSDTVCYSSREEIQKADPGVISVTEHTWTKSGDDASY